ncbi:MAG TPA: AAA family ATPase [Thermoleophilaceae bacterium]|nr:AAA family ATPase [Thermoleophilaceae bacterium]
MTAVDPLGLPGPLRLTPSFPFVGRSRDLDVLRGLMTEATTGGGRVALLAGEPGSGKSRLVRELAQEAAADGVVVLYGACDAVVRVPYGPFVTALEQLVRATEPDLLRADLGPGGGELTRILPDLAERVGELPAPLAGDPDTERHRLHSAIADLLVSVTARQPILMAIEDIHWADRSTLLLLRRLAGSAANARMLVLATLRDTDGEIPGELSETLIDLRRTEGVERLTLGGLSEEEVAEFVRRAGDDGPETAVGERAHEISELTDGNAFLMTELWRTLTETGTLESPESVRDVVSQRLSRLSPSTTEVLEVAGVAGPEFTLDLVRRAAALDERALLEALDEGVRSGMIEEVPGVGLAYRFTHELVRRALYDGLRSLRRAELHLRVGSVLEEDLGAAPVRGLADVAHHLAAAGALGDTERAIEYSLGAARAAMGALAFEQAAVHFRTALGLGVGSASERAEIQLELGRASHSAGSWADAVEAFAAAAEIARATGDVEMLARAAIGLEDAAWGEGRAHRAALDLLEEASAVLGGAESTLRVGLLSALTRVLAYRGDHTRAAITSANAMEMARALGDRRGLGLLLARAYSARGTRTLDEVIEMLAEAWALGEELGDLDIQSDALGWRVVAQIALGDLDAARRDLAEYVELAARAKQPFCSFTAEVFGAVIALCEGNLAEAEARAEGSREWARLLTGRDASGTHGIQMFSIRREQGRLGELAPVVRLLAGGDGGDAAWRPGLVALLVELGMHDEAREELARIRAHGLEAFREGLWLASLTYLTDACSAVGDAELAALLRPELEPYAGTVVIVGHGVACYGAADRYLGMLAATLGDWDIAGARFDAAMDLNRRMGARTWVAHTAYEHGRMLQARGRPEDAARAASLLSEAGALAGSIGMPALLARIDALGSAATAAALPDGLSPREVEILRLVARGLSNRQIGEELFISGHTAANHVRSILRKTSCANRTEAATYAHRHGLAADPSEA